MNIPDKQQKWKLYQSYIYDYVLDNNLDWPCTTCSWGSIISENSELLKQRVYFACRTDGIYNEADTTWQKLPSFLVVAQVDIPQVGKQFNQELRNVYLQDNLKKHKNLKVKQIIVHPGDANMMKKCYLNPKLLATKNDASQVFLWDLDKHRLQNQFRDGIHANTPDLTLIGHTSKTPSFALDWAKNNYRIGSGGKDQNVLIWDVDDYQTRLTSNYMQQFNTPQFTKRELNSIGNQNEPVKLKNSYCLSGHTDMIEDLSFSPAHKDVFVSVGDDKRLIGWDIRASSEKQFELTDLHDDDINCVEWSLKNENYVATGSSDGNAALIDIRKMKKIRSILIPSNINLPNDQQKNAIMSIRFQPSSNYLAIGSDNLFIYNLDDPQFDDQGIEKPIFTHFGQKGVINDFDWNTENPWSILSTCQELEHETMGGGSLQIFRPLDLIYMPKEEALQKLKENLIDYYQKGDNHKSNSIPRTMSIIPPQQKPLQESQQRMDEEEDNEDNQDEDNEDEEEEDEVQEASSSNGNNSKQVGIDKMQVE